MIKMNFVSHRHRKQTYGCQMGKRVGDKLAVWDEHIHTTMLQPTRDSTGSPT